MRLADFLFPVQIIVTKELDKDTHTWLRALSEKMEKQDIYHLLENIHQLKEKFDKELADSVLEVSVSANKQLVKELKGDDSMSQALLEIMQPELQEIERKLMEKWRKEGREEGIRHMITTLRNFGHSDVEIKEAIQTQYHLSSEEIKKYL